jgi:hypothetical protein
VFSLAALAVLAAGAWVAPAVLVHTSLRDRPLATALAGIDGSITSGSARWGWLSGIEYRDVVLRDREGRAAVVVPRMMVEKGLVHLALDPAQLGTMRLVGPQAMVVVREGGSSLEDIVAPWLAQAQTADSGGGSCDLEIVDGVVEFVHAAGADAWRVTDLIATVALESGAGPGSWTVAGRLRHAGPPATETAAEAEGGRLSEPVATTTDRLDRSTIPAAAAAVVIRDGGFSVSSPAADATGARTVTLAARRLPLGSSGIVAARCGFDHLLDGLADVRLDCDIGAAGPRLCGTVTVERFAACRADTLAEQFAIERCEMPFDVQFADEWMSVRKFAAVSPVFRAEATGRIGLPHQGVWQWAENLVGDDFALAVDVDLAAASRSLPGGLVVRPDVRVTGGQLQVAASARADGNDRVLEVRAAARDLAAVQSVAGAGPVATERPLRWTEPFTAWLRGRRGAARGLVIEESRIALPALEVSAAGDAAALSIQWTVDVGGLAAEVGEVFAAGGLAARGTSRGRVDILAGTPTTVKATASATGLELAVPGRPLWKDEDLTLEVEAAGGSGAGVVAIDRGRITVKAADDTFEARVEGGVLVDLAALGGISRSGVPHIRPAAEPEAVLAECALGGDLARWQARFCALVPALLPAGVELAGRVKAALAAAPRGQAWQVTRAGAEIEKFTVRCGDRQALEPRVMATAAGMIHPATGQIDVSSAEILSATLSLRSGGVSWMPANATAAPGSAALLDRLRGRVQWQADVGRLEPWLLPVATAARWPATGRAWGTIELSDGPGGADVLLEATGSQIGIASAAAGAAARPVWNEPRAVVALEVTRPLGAAGPADRLQIDRLSIESSTLAVAAKGSIEEWTTRGLVLLDGTAAYDWAQVSRLLVPYTGGRIQLAGAGGRPFTFRGPLGSAAPAAPAAQSPPPTPVPLPDDWLSAARASGSGAEALARIALPVAATPSRDRRLAGIRDISLDTSAAWTAATIDGITVAGGEAAIRLLEGQLAIGPFDVAASGGRLRGAPWIRFEPWPGELIVPPGRIVERVALSGSMCEQVATWLSPLLGHSTHTTGALSVDLAGARLPLGDPAAGELTGQVVFDALEVTPTAALAPLVKLLVKLQSLVDPRVAFGDKTVLLRVRPDPIRVRLASRRLWHEGLVMDAGQFTVKSAGSVGDDGTLAMEVEVALRGDLVGSTPILAQLVRTPLVIPLTGTVQRPQFDARAIDLMVARIVENTAQAVINDGIGRGLEAILGGPQPPPLTLPPTP